MENVLFDFVFLIKIENHSSMAMDSIFPNVNPGVLPLSPV